MLKSLAVSKAQARVLSPPETIRAVLFSIFSLVTMVMWPQWSLEHGYLFWWNPWVLFTSIGMVCLSISRFFGIEQAFTAPEIALGVILTQAVHFGMAYGHPSDQTGAFDELLFSFDTRFFGSECDIILGKLFAWSFPVKWFFVGDL